MRKRIVVIAILSIIYIIGFPIFKEYVLDAPYIVIIEVTGEKNDQSGGTEVWIDGIYRDGEILDIGTLQLDKGWENRGRLFNTGEESSKWKLYIRSKEKTSITFVTHPYSGIVKVIDSKGKVEVIDLYSSVQGIYSYTVNME